MAASTRCDVLAIGSDPATLAAALDCARVGLKVEVWIPQSVSFSNTEATFSNRGGIVVDFLSELKIPFTITQPSEGQQTICGIPANPFSAQVVSTLGWAGAWRVYLDRIKPILTIGNETNLGKLVSSRMGNKAVEQLVNPVTKKLYGALASQLAVDDVAPGLAQAMTRGGSLSGGVVEQFVADPRVCEEVIVAGGEQLIMDRLCEQLEYFAATIVRVKNASQKLLTNTKKAGVFLLDFSDVEVPEKLDSHQVFEVGISTENPGLEGALPASLHSAVAARRVLLSTPEKPVIGPHHVSS